MMYRVVISSGCSHFAHCSPDVGEISSVTCYLIARELHGKAFGFAQVFYLVDVYMMYFSHKKLRSDLKQNLTCQYMQHIESNKCWKMGLTSNKSWIIIKHVNTPYPFLPKKDAVWVI